MTLHPHAASTIQAQPLHRYLLLLMVAIVLVFTALGAPPSHAKSLAPRAVVSDEEKAALDAVQEVREQVKANPKDDDARNELGRAVLRLADQRSGEARRKLLHEAVTHFRASQRLQRHSAPLRNWGLALAALAEMSTGGQRKQYRDEATAKFEAALKQARTETEGAIIGLLLVDLAEQTTGAKQRQWFRESLRFEQDAAKEEPDNIDAINGIAYAASSLFHTSESQTERQSMLDIIETAAKEGQRITAGPTYNMACFVAMKGDAAGFVTIADTLTGDEMPDADHLRNDRDLNGIRATPEFQAWWRKKFGDAPSMPVMKAVTK